MGRAAIVILIVAALAALYWGLIKFVDWYKFRSIKRGTGREIVMKDIYEERARDNYLLLGKTVDFIQELVAQDEIVTTLTFAQKAQAENLIDQYNKNQLPKGKGK